MFLAERGGGEVGGGAGKSIGSGKWKKEILKWCLVIGRRKGHVGFRNRVGSVCFFLGGGSIPIVACSGSWCKGLRRKSKDGEEGGLGGGKVAGCDCWWKRKGDKVNKRSNSERQKENVNIFCKLWRVIQKKN